MNAVHFGIDFWEHIHRAHWFDAGNTGDLVDQLPCLIALFQQAAAGQDKLVDALIAAQGRLNGVLHRCIGTQTHGGEHIEAFDIALGMMFRTVEHHPTLAETGDAVGFGEAVKSNGQQVGGEGGNVMVYGVVVKNFVVNFIGKNNQAVFTCQFGNFQQDFFAVHRAGRVVGVDDDDGFGFRRNFGFYIGQIREPVVFFVTQIMTHIAAGQCCGGGPQWIIRRRN